MSNGRFTDRSLGDAGVFVDTGPVKSVHTRLEPRNEGRSIDEGLQARVNDPLFFLGRQWQTSEFKAHNGGQLVRTELDISTKPLNQIMSTRHGDEANAPESFGLDEPLEMKAEEELGDSSNLEARHWDARHLEYNFSVTDGDTILEADEYDGQYLDWHSFKVAAPGSFDGFNEHLSVRPSLISFPGAPLPRWWSFEDRLIHFGETKRSQLSFLTMLLTEFTLLYSNNWFVLPISHPVGHIRRINSFTAMDSFGVIFEVNPVIDSSSHQRGWEAFTLTDTNQTKDGRLLYMPNSLYHSLESEAYESVSFIRDETANLVWAIEHAYQTSDGEVVNRHDEETLLTKETPRSEQYWDTEQRVLVHRSEIQDEGEPGNRYQGPVSIYVPKTAIPSNWIPYLSRQLTEDNQPALRRGRTEEDLSVGPQYKGVIVKESKWLFDEEVQLTAVKLSRAYQLARDKDGNRYVWRSRKKTTDDRRPSSGLRFDSLTTDQ